MKRILLAAALSLGFTGVAAATDAPMATDTPMAGEAAMAPAQAYDWSGLYAGAVAGYGWGNSKHCDGSFSPPCQAGYPEFDLTGGTGGVTLGFNWQSADWVFGIEADYSWGDIDGSSPTTAAFGCGGPGQTCNTDIESYGTVRGRLGYAMDRFLAYVTAGVAISQLHASIGSPIVAQDTDTATSFTAGGGVEFAFGSNWSGKIEYLYVDSPSDFNYDTVLTCGAPGCFTRDNSFSTVRAGINYRFNWDPLGPGY